MKSRESDRFALIGTVFGEKYEIIGFIGRGGMGAVYRAIQHPLGRTVALKVLEPRPNLLRDDVGFEKRFFREAEVYGRLTHRNTVTIYDYGREDLGGRPFFYMALELVEGRTLSAEIALGPLPVRRALRVALAITRALKEAHQIDVIHRDLKPSNVMLPDSGSPLVKVMDFGIAKPVTEGDGSTVQTASGVVLGSPSYMAPEQIVSRQVDGRVDVYALGVILYEMLVGRLPFVGTSKVDTLRQHLEVPVPRLRGQRLPERDGQPPEVIPRQVERLVMRCLEKDPADRFRDMATLQKSLQRALERKPDWSLLPVSGPMMGAAVGFALGAGIGLLYVGHGLLTAPTPTVVAGTPPVVVEAPTVGRWVRSVPEGAEVWVEGEMLGRTPLRLDAHHEGAEVLLQLEGFASTRARAGGPPAILARKSPAEPAVRPPPAPPPSDVRSSR